MSFPVIWMSFPVISRHFPSFPPCRPISARQWVAFMALIPSIPLIPSILPPHPINFSDKQSRCASCKSHVTRTCQVPYLSPTPNSTTAYGAVYSTVYWRVDWRSVSNYQTGASDGPPGHVPILSTVLSTVITDFVLVIRANRGAVRPEERDGP